jgi:hypothetical protein
LETYFSVSIPDRINGAIEGINENILIDSENIWVISEIQPEIQRKNSLQLPIVSGMSNLAARAKYMDTVHDKNKFSILNKTVSHALSCKIHH